MRRLVAAKEAKGAWGSEREGLDWGGDLQEPTQRRPSTFNTRGVYYCDSRRSYLCAQCRGRPKVGALKNKFRFVRGHGGGQCGRQ